MGKRAIIGRTWAVIALLLVAAALLGRPASMGTDPSDARAAPKGFDVCAAGRGGPRVGVVEPGPRGGVDTGITSTRWPGGHRVAACLGARVARVEFPIGTPVARMRPTFASLTRRGVRILPMAGFKRRLPSPGEARSLERWAREFGPGGAYWRSRRDGGIPIREIEFGNETSYTYQFPGRNGRAAYAKRARTYGRRAATAVNALEGTGVGLMVQAEDAGVGADWVANVLAAAPRLGERVAAWTVHPYGPDWAAKLDQVVASTRAAGAPDTVPIAVTEWGLATAGGRCVDDNYRWSRCLSYREAGRLGRSVVGAMQRRLGGRLSAFLLYTSQDLDFQGPTRQREDYFGAARVDQSEKGAYTGFVRDLFAGRLTRPSTARR